MKNVLLPVFCTAFLLSPASAQSAHRIVPTTPTPMGRVGRVPAAPPLPVVSPVTLTETTSQTATGRTAWPTSRPRVARPQFAIRGDALYLIRNGRSLRVTPNAWLKPHGPRVHIAHSPALSPNGRMVAYVHEYRANGRSQYALWKIPLHGTHVGNPLLLRDARHMPDFVPSAALHLRWMNDRYLALRENDSTTYYDAVGNELDGPPRVCVALRQTR